MVVEGNQKGEEVAKIGAETSGVQRSPEQFTSQAQVGRTVIEQNWKKAKN